MNVIMVILPRESYRERNKHTESFLSHEAEEGPALMPGPLKAIYRRSDQSFSVWFVV